MKCNWEVNETYNLTTAACWERTPVMLLIPIPRQSTVCAFLHWQSLGQEKGRRMTSLDAVWSCDAAATAASNTTANKVTWLATNKKPLFILVDRRRRRRNANPQFGRTLDTTMLYTTGPLNKIVVQISSLKSVSKLQVCKLGCRVVINRRLISISWFSLKNLHDIHPDSSIPISDINPKDSRNWTW